jgi:hypothetical protein
VVESLLPDLFVVLYIVMPVYFDPGRTQAVISAAKRNMVLAASFTEVVYILSYDFVLDIPFSLTARLPVGLLTTEILVAFSRISEDFI